MIPPAESREEKTNLLIWITSGKMPPIERSQGKPRTVGGMGAGMRYKLLLYGDPLKAGSFASGMSDGAGEVAGGMMGAVCVMGAKTAGRLAAVRLSSSTICM